MSWDIELDMFKVILFSTWVFVRVNLCQRLLMEGINHCDKMPELIQLNTLQPVIVGRRMAS